MNAISTLIARLTPAAFGLGVAVVVFSGLGNWPLKSFLAVLVGVMALSILVTAWHLLPRQFLVDSLWAFTVFALGLRFIGIDIGFREDWPFAVIGNGYEIMLADATLATLILFWSGRVWRGEKKLSFPRAWLWFFAGMLSINLLNALFIAREPFFAYSLIWTEFKIMIIAFFVTNFMEPRHLRMMGFAFAGILLLEAIAVLDQRSGQLVFNSTLLKTEVSLKSAAGNDYVLRFGGTMGHPNTLAAFLDTAILWVWFMIPGERRSWPRFFLISSLILGFATLTITGSRGAWLGLGIALSLGMLAWMKKNGKNLLVGGGIMLVTVTMLFTALFYLSDTFSTRLTQEDRGSAMVREPLNETALNIVRDKPLTGIGLGQYTREMHYYDRTNLQVASWYNQPVHNMFLLTAAESGIPALILMLAFLFKVMWDGWQTFRHGSGIYADAGLTTVGATLAWILQEQANPDYVFMPTILWFVWAAMLAARRHESEGLTPQ